MPSDVVIETGELTKTYGPVRAVAGLNLSVGAAQVFGFLGPNGAGKTTTIRLLLALQRPSSGSSRVFGLDSMSDSLEIHRRVGYLPGDLALYPRLTGAQHIEWFAGARGGANRADVGALVERFGVVTDRPVRDLSSGNRQKIGLVLAFMHRPELLILDEPTSGLDPLLQYEFERLARETVAEGRTVFLSSHDLDEVQRLADRVAIIKSGSLVATDTVDGLRRAAPRRVEVVLPGPAARTGFDSLVGVKVVACHDHRLALEVSGPIAPVLRAVADQDPVDVVIRHADLDELFLDFYRGPSTP
jgi:ABC-2 type transport system ATP-binding protein